MADVTTTPDWLERANRLTLTSTLLATTVHEVNNALQVISGSAEMLTPSSTPDIIHRRTEAIGAHARRASALLAELSAFAKDESTNTTQIDLGQVAQRALAMRQYTIAKLKLESSYESTGDSRVVIVNARLILQVALNLLVNAERALASKPGGRIAVSVDGGSEHVRLSIEDDGPGVAADAVSKLFVPGALASETHLGIGLSVAKQLAGRFSGDVSYAPRSAGGSRFALTLPAASITGQS